jgi:hypothetical protein
MSKTVSLMLAGALAVAGLGLTIDQGEARHRDRSGFSFGFTYGDPYPYYPRYHRTYPREYYYAYPAPRRYVYQPAPRRAYRGDWGAHVAWCYDRWRSYRQSDNSYQPYNGPRRECRSPFFG